jgi:acetyl-CoA carboxylase carboxyltransferase component
MTILPSRLDRRSESWIANRAAMEAALVEVRAAWARAAQGGGNRPAERHRARGRMLARERVELLLDRDAPFVEIGALAGLHEGGTVPGGSMVGGVGRVAGVDCVISASDPTVQGGAVTPWGLRRGARLAEIGLENHLPEIHLVESAGADLTQQADLFVPGGGAFRHLARRSAAGLPTLALVFGSCTAGGAYVPGMADVSVFVEGAATVYLAGPPLVRMALGEVVDDETLGGARMHATRSGVADALAVDEVDALRLGRSLLGRLARRSAPRPPCTWTAPRYDADDLLGLPSADPRVPFDLREVLARVLDGSDFDAFKPLYGPTLLCGWGHVGGWPVGVLANAGVLHADSAEKGAQFVQLCDRAGTPLLFLQDIAGFMVGRDAEERGIIKAGAKLIHAVSNATVPAITWMIGGSYGAGNYAMMGRAYRPRFLFSWPSHRIAVMGADQLAGVLDIVRRDAAARSGREVDEAELAQLKQMLSGKVAHESTWTAATGRLWDDGVVDPRDTRALTAWVLSIAARSPGEGGLQTGVIRQ